MNIEPTVPTAKNPAGPVRRRRLARPDRAPHEPDQTMVVATVRFAPGARTAWHSHEHGQYLRVTQGVGRFGGRDGKIIEVHPGQTLYTPPGEEHWHAAAPGCFMEHIAMLQNGEDPADDHHLGRAHHRRRVQRKLTSPRTGRRRGALDDGGQQKRAPR